MAIRQVTRAGVGLVIGIILLAALVFAGLWFVRERGEQARRTEAINIADQQLKAESEQGVALNTDDSAKPADESENTNTSNNSTNNSAATNTAPAELPKTGPEATSIIVTGIVTFAAVSFVRSRKLLASRL